MKGHKTRLQHVEKSSPEVLDKKNVCEIARVKNVENQTEINQNYIDNHIQKPHHGHDRPHMIIQLRHSTLRKYDTTSSNGAVMSP